jgi:CO/xanthine dehydrogenase FAD-binding subunit
MAGGLDILRRNQHALFSTANLVDLTDIPEMSAITQCEHVLCVGATATCTQIAEHPLVQKFAPALAIATGQFGTWQIRNRCTLGGLILHGGGESHLLPVLYALNAKIVCLNDQDTRKFTCEEFFPVPQQTALSSGEVISAIELPLTQRYSTFLKRLSQSPYHPPKISVAIAFAISDEQFNQVRIAVGTPGSLVMRATQTEGLLEGQPIDYVPLLLRVAKEVRRSARPASDEISNARYRKWSLGILTLRGLTKLLDIHKQNSHNYQPKGSKI